MNLDSLNAFLEIARLGSFSRAASRVYRTQPALSRQVRLLEREYGEKLFDRMTTGVQLTRAGGILRLYAQQMLDLKAEALETIAETRQEPRGRLRLGANDATCLYVLPQAFARFRQLHPSLQISIYRSFSHKLVEKIQEGVVEVAIVSLPHPANNIETVSIFQDEVQALVAANHPLVKSPNVSLAELAHYPLILPKAGRTRAMIEHLMRPYRRHLNVAMELDGIESIKRFVACGLGISLITRTFARTEVAAGALHLIPLQGYKLYRELGLIHRRNGHLSLPAKIFIAVVCEAAKVLSQFTPPSLAPRGNGDSCRRQ